MTLRVAMLGLGYWGPNLARTLAAAEGVSLSAVCDTDAMRLAKIGSRYPGVAAHTDPIAVIESDSIDAVVIATPADTHFALASAAIRNGKHVLVEKPLARTVVEADELVRLAEEHGVVLMPAHVFLYNAAVRKVREYITSGELGDIHYVYSQRLNLGQVRRDVNALWNFAPHDVSIISHWLDASAQRVVARGYSYLQPGIEDVVFMTLDYPGGVGANVHISWLDPQKVRMMTVVGSEKMVVYDDTSSDARIRLIDKGVTKKLAGGAQPSLGSFDTFAEFQLMLRAGDVVIPKLDFVEPLQLEVADFVRAVRDGTPPLSDARSGLEVVRVLEAAQASLKADGVPQSV